MADLSPAEKAAQELYPAFAIPGMPDLVPVIERAAYIKGAADERERAIAIAESFMMQTEAETRWHRKRKTEEWLLHCRARDIAEALRALAAGKE